MTEQKNTQNSENVKTETTTKSGEQQTDTHVPAKYERFIPTNAKLIIEGQQLVIDENGEEFYVPAVIESAHSDLMIGKKTQISLKNMKRGVKEAFFAHLNFRKFEKTVPGIKTSTPTECINVFASSGENKGKDGKTYRQNQCTIMVEAVSLVDYIADTEDIIVSSDKLVGAVKATDESPF